MAADWIKMRKSLPDDPAVINIATRLKITRDEVVGKLHRLWSWADEHTRDGNAVGVTTFWVDAFLQRDGFAEALESVAWLRVAQDRIVFPNFDRHMSQSAKKRAITAQRVDSHRGKTCNAVSVTKALPEKRREEKKKRLGSQPPADPSFDCDDVAKAWRKASKKGGLRELVTFGRMRQERVQALASVQVFCQRWQESIERASKTPFCTGGGPKGWRMSFDSWLKHWSDVLEGKYDDEKPPSAADSKGVLDRLEQAGAIGS